MPFPQTESAKRVEKSKFNVSVTATRLSVVAALSHILIEFGQCRTTSKHQQQRPGCDAASAACELRRAQKRIASELALSGEQGEGGPTR